MALVSDVGKLSRPIDVPGITGNNTTHLGPLIGTRAPHSGDYPVGQTLEDVRCMFIQMPDVRYHS